MKWNARKAEIDEWKRHRGKACNPFEGDCAVCGENAKFAIHHYIGKRPKFYASHIGTCGEMRCIKKTVDAGYVGCGCGG